MHLRKFLVFIVSALSAIYLISILATSCSKKDTTTPPPPPPPPVPKTTFSVDSLNTQPGLFLTITANQLITKDTCTVLLAGNDIFLTELDSLHYFFLVPVLPPGNYILDLKNLDAGNNPQVIVRNYETILNSDTIISRVETEFNILADTLAQNSIFNGIPLVAGIFYTPIDGPDPTRLDIVYP